MANTEKTTTQHWSDTLEGVKAKIESASKEKGEEVQLNETKTQKWMEFIQELERNYIDPDELLRIIRNKHSKYTIASITAELGKSSDKQELIEKLKADLMTWSRFLNSIQEKCRVKKSEISDLVEKNYPGGLILLISHIKNRCMYTYYYSSLTIFNHILQEFKEKSIPKTTEKDVMKIKWENIKEMLTSEEFGKNPVRPEDLAIVLYSGKMTTEEMLSEMESTKESIDPKSIETSTLFFDSIVNLRQQITEHRNSLTHKIEHYRKHTREKLIDALAEKAKEVPGIETITSDDLSCLIDSGHLKYKGWKEDEMTEEGVIKRYIDSTCSTEIQSSFVYNLALHIRDLKYILKNSEQKVFRTELKIDNLDDTKFKYTTRNNEDARKNEKSVTSDHSLRKKRGNEKTPKWKAKLTASEVWAYFVYRGTHQCRKEEDKPTILEILKKYKDKIENSSPDKKEQILTRIASLLGGEKYNTADLLLKEHNNNLKNQKAQLTRNQTRKEDILFAEKTQKTNKDYVTEVSRATLFTSAGHNKEYTSQIPYAVAITDGGWLYAILSALSRCVPSSLKNCFSGGNTTQVVTVVPVDPESQVTEPVADAFRAKNNGCSCFPFSLFKKSRKNRSQGNTQGVR